jgi:hypothetical protein
MGSGLTIQEQQPARIFYTNGTRVDDILAVFAKTAFQRFSAEGKLSNERLQSCVSQLIIADNVAKKYFHIFLRSKSAAKLLSIYIVSEIACS